MVSDGRLQHQGYHKKKLPKKIQSFGGPQDHRVVHNSPSLSRRIQSLTEITAIHQDPNLREHIFPINVSP